MFILNKEIVTLSTTASAPGRILNIRPSTIDGSNDLPEVAGCTTKITNNSIITDRIISKIIALDLPADGFNSNAPVNNFYISLSNLGIRKSKAVIAAVLLGIYNPNSIESNIGGTVDQGTPSFIGMFDFYTKTSIGGEDTGVSVFVQGDSLALRVPDRNINLFRNKHTIIQLYYSSHS